MQQPFIYIIDLLKRRIETAKQSNNFFEISSKDVRWAGVQEIDRETVCSAPDDTNTIATAQEHTHTATDWILWFHVAAWSQTSGKEIIILHRIFVRDGKLLFLKGNISFGFVLFFLLFRLLSRLLLRHLFICHTALPFSFTETRVHLFVQRFGFFRVDSATIGL